jgi:outer membrane protein OmpA-like peptidoglycan-associated protein
MQASMADVLARARHLILVATVSALPLIASVGPAGAQRGVDLNTDNVTVDLSVIGESHRPARVGAASTAPIATPSGGGLLVPGPSTPRSQLHVAVPYGPDSVVKLRPPSGAPKQTVAPTPAKKAAPAKPRTPAKPAEPPAAATEPPAPLTAAPPPPAVIAAPVMPTTKSELPPTAAEPVKKKEEAAGKVATAAPAPAAAKTEQAATTPPSGEAKETRALQVVFSADVSKLPNEAKDGLSLLAKKLKDNETMRLQLLAYAGGKDLPASKARRLSLSRALSVRSYLIENGIRSTRIDVRALGDKVTDEPANRVDVNIVER